ncbi:hypothetical protein PGLA_15930 [Paenibacillus glacialis]|uniref:Uncharacterized protein n=2 Tax=Paenibacillus glacialis TaxID=494026 RepID=A0A162LYB3_9BACL|nr:hypothetical protein PGLA_15930 [Paenibacillus glacialis]
MALGYLVFLFIIIAVISIFSIVLLFVVKDRRSNNAIFIVTAILGVLINYMSVTVLPDNYVVSRIAAGSFGILSIIGIILMYMKKKTMAKVMVAASVVLGVLQLFFF